MDGVGVTFGTERLYMSGGNFVPKGFDLGDVSGGDFALIRNT